MSPVALSSAALSPGRLRSAADADGRGVGQPPGGRGTIPQVTSRSAAAQRLADLARLRRVRDRIDREYAQPLNVEALARGVNMSSGHLSREFRSAYGESPYAYLMTRRIERAMALLRHGDLTVTEVCFAVGCSSLGTFSTRFTELVGVPPSVYRRQATRAVAGMPPCVAKQVTRPVRHREQREHHEQPEHRAQREQREHHGQQEQREHHDECWEQPALAVPANGPSRPR